MATRNFRLDKIYQNRTKDVASLRTWDIDGSQNSQGARAQPRIRELKVLSHQSEKSDGIFATGPSRVFRPEEYNPLRNPTHFSDDKHLQSKGISLEGQQPILSSPAQIRGEERLDINSKHYKDSLEQYVEQRAEGSIRGSPASTKPWDQDQLELKGNMANFYALDEPSAK